MNRFLNFQSSHLIVNCFALQSQLGSCNDSHKWITFMSRYFYGQTPLRNWKHIYPLKQPKRRTYIKQKPQVPIFFSLSWYCLACHNSPHNLKLVGGAFHCSSSWKPLKWSETNNKISQHTLRLIEKDQKVMVTYGNNNRRNQHKAMFEQALISKLQK